MSATSGPRTRMCAISPSAKTVATPTSRLAAASAEWMSVAGSTASRATAKSPLVSAKACVRRIRATTRTAGICAMTMKDVLARTMIPISAGPTGVWAFAKGRQDVGEQRVADDDEHEVGCDHREEEPISSDGAKTFSVGVCRCDGHGSRARYCSEHDQRESGVGDSVEEIENLERAEPLCSCDDEAGYGRA